MDNADDLELNSAAAPSHAPIAVTVVSHDAEKRYMAELAAKRREETRARNMALIFMVILAAIAGVGYFFYSASKQLVAKLNEPAPPIGADSNDNPWSFSIEKPERFKFNEGGLDSYLVKLKISNIGNAPLPDDKAVVMIQDSKGRMNAPENITQIHYPINPGVSCPGMARFVIPSDTSPVSLALVVDGREILIDLTKTDPVYQAQLDTEARQAKYEEDRRIAYLEELEEKKLAQNQERKLLAEMQQKREEELRQKAAKKQVDAIAARGQDEQYRRELEEKRKAQTDQETEQQRVEQAQQRAIDLKDAKQRYSRAKDKVFSAENLARQAGNELDKAQADYNSRIARVKSLGGSVTGRAVEAQDYQLKNAYQDLNMASIKFEKAQANFDRFKAKLADTDKELKDATAEIERFK